MIETIFIGRSLIHARTAQIGSLLGYGSVAHALLVGEGNGTFLIAFAQAFPNARITVIDESAEMLRIAQARFAAAGLDAGQVEFIVADVQAHVLPERCYDVIVTHFFFDNFKGQAVQRMIGALEQACTPNAHWLLADYCIPATGWRAWRARIWLKGLYAFFGLFASVATRALPDTETYMDRTSFKLLGRKSFCGEMLYSAHYRR